MNKYQLIANQITEKVKNELNLDVMKYKDTLELTKIIKLIDIYGYTISRISKNILLFMLVFITGYFVINITLTKVIIYTIIGFPLFLATGIVYGLFSLVNSFKKDMNDVIDSSIKLLEYSIEDLKNINYVFSTKENNPISLLFEGLLFALLVPTITKSVGKAPFIGSTLSKI